MVSEEENADAEPRPEGSWFNRHKIQAKLVLAGLVLAIPAGLAECFGYSVRDLLFPAATSSSTLAPVQTITAGAAPTEAGGTGGWGPERAVYSMASGGAPYAAYNCIIDNPDYGDERNFMTVRDASRAEDYVTGFVDRIKVQENHEYEVRILVNNCGPDKDIEAESSWIHDAKAILVHTREVSRSQAASIFLSGTNVTKVWDSVTLWSDRPFSIASYPGDAKLISNAHPIPGMQVSQDLLTRYGFKLGYETMNGKLRPGYQDALYLYVKFRVIFD